MYWKLLRLKRCSIYTFSLASRNVFSTIQFLPFWLLTIFYFYILAPTTLSVQHSSLAFHSSHGGLSNDPCKLFVSVNVFTHLAFPVFSLDEIFFLYLTYFRIIHACTKANVNWGYFMNFTVYIHNKIIKLWARVSISSTMFFRKHIHVFYLFYYSRENQPGAQSNCWNITYKMGVIWYHDIRPKALKPIY